MAKQTYEELESQLKRSQLQTKKLLEEVEVKNNVVKLLLIVGALDKDKLEQATELAGGI